MKFSFVILHYNVVAETQACVKSIKERVHIPVEIVIVDNCSPNDSGKELFELYKNDNQVTVLLSEKNLGFAKGNNIGIQYARKTLNSDFVVVLNNDTYLVQDDFCEVILDEWEYSHFAVLGPRVHTFSGKNQNPVAHQISTIAQVHHWIWHHRKGLIRSYLGLDSLWLTYKDCLKHFLGYKNAIVAKNTEKQKERQENVKLHGCCLVFSPKFFEYFEGFDPRTFMYVEEDILLAHIRKKGLLTVYNPKLEIFHAEKAATKSVTKTVRKKKIFGYTEGIKSLKVLKNVLEE